MGDQSRARAWRNPRFVARRTAQHDERRALTVRATSGRAASVDGRRAETLQTPTSSHQKLRVGPIVASAQKGVRRRARSANRRSESEQRRRTSSCRRKRTRSHFAARRVRLFALVVGTTPDARQSRRRSLAIRRADRAAEKEARCLLSQNKIILLSKLLAYLRTTSAQFSCIVLHI